MRTEKSVATAACLRASPFFILTMLAASVRNAACSTPRALQKGVTSSARRASSSAVAKTTDSSSSKVASSSQSTYLNSERKRKLVSLYHESADFVNLENLSSYIDKRFARVRNSDKDIRNNEDSSVSLDRALAEQRDTPKTTVVSAGNYDSLKLMHFDSALYRNVADEIRDERLERVKSVMYGVDDVSQKASIEMAEKFMREGNIGERKSSS